MKENVDEYNYEDAIRCACTQTLGSQHDCDYAFFYLRFCIIYVFDSISAEAQCNLTKNPLSDMMKTLSSHILGINIFLTNYYNNFTE
jgi:hypothetical protein